MRKIISRVSAICAILGAIMIILANFFPEEGYILFWLGVVVIVFSGIAYLATGEKIKEWFWEFLNFF